jgi:hypothetical protein
MHVRGELARLVLRADPAQVIGQSLNNPDAKLGEICGYRALCGSIKTAGIGRAHESGSSGRSVS